MAACCVCVPKDHMRLPIFLAMDVTKEAVMLGSQLAATISDESCQKGSQCSRVRPVCCAELIRQVERSVENGLHRFTSRHRLRGGHTAGWVAPIYLVVDCVRHKTVQRNANCVDDVFLGCGATSGTLRRLVLYKTHGLGCIPCPRRCVGVRGQSIRTGHQEIDHSRSALFAVLVLAHLPRRYERQRACRLGVDTCQWCAILDERVSVAETCCLCEEFGCKAFDVICQASVQRTTATLSVFASGTVPDTKTHVTTLVEAWTIHL